MICPACLSLTILTRSRKKRPWDADKYNMIKERPRIRFNPCFTCISEGNPIEYCTRNEKDDEA